MNLCLSCLKIVNLLYVLTNKLLVRRIVPEGLAERGDLVRNFG